MIIDRPYIEDIGNECFLISNIKDEKNHIEEKFFFSVSNEYKKYLVDDVADAFVVAMLLPALISGQNIKVNAPLTDILYYHLENSLIYLLSKVFKKNPIKIVPEETLKIDFNSSAVGTGFSGGIDSFSTVTQHISENCPENLKITHLTLFNVGSYGNNFGNTQKAFISDLKRAESFANEVNLPIVSLNSNISSAYTAKEIFHFSSRSSMCLGAGVLSLQKLFSRYLISSSGVLEDIRFVQHDQYFYEPLIFPLLSNNNTQIVLSNANLDRVEKTKNLLNNDMAQRHLYVCASDIYNEKHGTDFKKGTKPNCSECIKCTRTMLTLDILNSLNKYSNRFDIDKYNNLRKELIYQTIQRKNIDHFSKEIYDLMIKENFSDIKEINKKSFRGEFKTKLLKNKIVFFIYINFLRKLLKK